MDNDVMDLVNRVTRSTVAVVDTVAGRGGFSGEELSTIGQLRDQCISGTWTTWLISCQMPSALLICGRHCLKGSALC